MTKRILNRKHISEIVLRLNAGETPKQISKDYPEYTDDMVFIVARRTGFGYHKKNGEWYVTKKI